VHHHPGNPPGRVNLGNLLYKRDDFTGARAQFEAALAAEPEFDEAHQGLARTLTELGHPATAEPHWQKGFAGHAVVVQSYRGSAPAVPVLLPVSARGGNIPTQYILDNRTFAVVALYADFYDPAQKLPPHAVVFNAVGDADLCDAALAGAEAVLAHTSAPVINPPQAVRTTGRVMNARRLAGLPGVIVPSTVSKSRSAIASAAGLSFPLLVRMPGYHTGQHFRCVERRTDLAAEVAALPGDEILLLEYLDARGADGMARKYRVMIVDDVLYPLHPAISAGWKVLTLPPTCRRTQPFARKSTDFLVICRPSRVRKRCPHWSPSAGAWARLWRHRFRHRPRRRSSAVRGERDDGRHTAR